jgi:DNA (cytosine-5)-methyltransferase 1
LNVLDLFSGIGGFSLGLERAGMRTVAFCEIDPFCRRVLAKHWPSVPIFDDVTKLRGPDVGSVDVICGGFPCQDISLAGKGAGLAGERSGLWRDYARLIGELRPSYVIVENVAALLGRGLGDVLGDLASLGYDAEWHCIPASAIGAPHRRDRLWIVAYTPTRSMHKGSSAGAMTRLSGASRLNDRLDYAVEQGNIKTGRLNPLWVAWLMGFPIEWASFAPTETP